MPPDFLISTTIVFFLGLSLTFHIIDREDRKAFDTLLQYLRVPSRVGYEAIECLLLEHVRLAAQRGTRILDRLDGYASNADRNAVRDVLERCRELETLGTPIPSHLPSVFASPCQAQRWWVEFEVEWRVLRRHVAKGLPAARRHFRQHRPTA